MCLGLPAQALPILIDNFTNSTTPNPLRVNSTIPSPVSSIETISNDLSTSTRRQATLEAVNATNAQPATLTIGSSQFATEAGSGSQRTAASTLFYDNFGNFNFNAAGTDRFLFNFTQAGANSTDTTIRMAVNGNLSPTQTFANPVASTPVTFLFSDFAGSPSIFNNVSSLQIYVSTSNGNRATLGSVRADVPVPAAFLGTLLGVGLAATKGLKKKLTS